MGKGMGKGSGKGRGIWGFCTEAEEGEKVGGEGREREGVVKDALDGGVGLG